MEEFYNDVDEEGTQSFIPEGSSLLKDYYTVSGNRIEGSNVRCEFQKILNLTTHSKLVITSCHNTIGAKCTACGQVMGLAVVEKNEENLWEIRRSKAFITSLGRNGVLPDGKLIKLGQNITGLMFDLYSSAFGLESLDKVIYSLEDFSLIFNSPISASNSGNCGRHSANACYKFDSVVKVEDNRKGYGMVTVTTRGTDASSGKIKSANKISKYCFWENSYRLGCSN